MSLSRRIVLTFVLLFSCFLVTKAQALAGASFSLSPATGVCIPGGTFDLDIIIKSDEPVGGATAIIHYDPSILEGVSLTPGEFFPTHLIKRIDSSTGIIRLDRGTDVENPNNLSGETVFGTIKFKVLRVGSATLSFDFTKGSTKDSNIAHAETFRDILTSVTGGSYTFQEGNTNPGLDPSCVPGGGSTPTPTPTPTTAPGAPTPTPTTPPAGGGAPEGGILGPTIFLSLLSLLMVGAGFMLR